MYSIKQTAKELNISAITVRRMISDARIKAVKIGRNWKISIGEINRIKKNGTR